MDAGKLQSIIKLLDDPDEVVFHALEQELVAEGMPVVKQLEDAWEHADNPLVHERIEDITHRIHLTDNATEFQEWAQTPRPCLIEAAYLIAKYQYPALDETEFKDRIKLIGEDLKNEINASLTPLEKIKAANHIMFRVHRFERAKQSNASSQWFFINNVLNQKKGNNQSLCLLYAAVAQYADLPIYGLNIPENLTLSYVNPCKEDSVFNRESPLFYINPYNRGAVFGTLEINDFMQRNNRKVTDEHFTPIRNYKLVALILESLESYYRSIEKKNRARDVAHLIQIVEQHGQDLYNV